MITAVLDANVLASGFLRANPGAAPSQLIDAWRADRFTAFVSEHVLAEVLHTFEDRYFLERMTPREMAQTLRLLNRDATLITITAHVSGVATHPEDDLVLATAVSGRVDYLVTGDLKLQRLGAYQGIKILSPRAFVEVLERE